MRKMIIAAAVVSTVLSACTGEPATTQPSTPVPVTSAGPQTAADYLFDQQRRLGESLDGLPPIEHNLAELLPNQLFSIDGAEAHPLAAGIVVGSVKAVEPGEAYLHPDDSPTSVPTDFDAPNAVWRSLLVTLEPERAWGACCEAGKDVMIAMAVSADIDSARLMRGLREAGRLIVVLDDDQRLLSGSDALTIRRSGLLLGRVNDSGALSFPGVADEPDFLGELTDLDAVAEAATAARERIDVHDVDGMPVRGE